MSGADLAAAEPSCADAIAWIDLKNRDAITAWRMRLAAHARGACFPDPRDRRARDVYVRVTLRASKLRGIPMRVAPTLPA